MKIAIPGIHHVTAIASDPQTNLDFYTSVLGLRLLKVTVNFDDPGTYHFYFGDEVGHPGTILTFFPWPGARRGRRGTGEVGATAFSVPEGALNFWRAHLTQHSVAISETQVRFGEEVLVFSDPDGTQLELIAHAGAGRHEPWAGGPIPPDYAIRGFHGVTLWLAEEAPSAALLMDVLGFERVGKEGARSRFKAASDDTGVYADILERPDLAPGQMGAGSVHHVAWRTANDEEQQIWRATLLDLGYQVTPVRDRQYFHSIYFHEPGGVLYEIATDPPGFMLDESPEELGSQLRLPPWLEPRRSELEAALPPIRRPQPAT